MKDESARREELIAAALTGDLTDAERQEFDRAATEDPSIVEELEELRGTAARLDAAEVTWVEGTASEELEKRILAATSEAEAEERVHHGQDAKPASPSER